MKKRILSLALALVMCLGLLSTAALAAEYKVTVTHTQYTDCGDMTEGLMLVCVGDREAGTAKWGFVNAAGQEVIPCQYDSAREFHNGIAWVGMKAGENTGICGGIDTAGNVVIPPKYEDVDYFREGLSTVKLGGKWGVIDKTDKMVVSPKYDERIYFSSDGLAQVAMGKYPNAKYGFIDKTGKEVVPCKYDSVGSFREGLVSVELNGKWGIIDKTGKEVVPCKYDSVGSFYEGLAKVKQGDKWGFVDKTGNEVVPCKYDSSSSFFESLAQVQLGGKYGFIDTAGQEVVPCKYGTAGDFSDGLAAVEQDGKWGYIDKTGKWVIPCEYTGAKSFSDGLAAVRLGSKYGFIDKAGKAVIPLVYDEHYDSGSQYGYLSLRKDGQWFYFDKTGQLIFRFDKLVFFRGKSLAVTRGADKKWDILTWTAPTAYPSTQKVNVDGKDVEFAMYALNGGSVNYIRVRDLAALLNGTAAQFEVGWDGNVALTSKTPYTGSTDKAPFNTAMAYTVYGSPTYVDGKAVNLDAIQIEYNGGGFTYYKLRDLAQALGFNVGWSAEKGVYVETNKPYNPNN